MKKRVFILTLAALVLVVAVTASTAIAAASREKSAQSEAPVQAEGVAAPDNETSEKDTRVVQTRREKSSWIGTQYPKFPDVVARLRASAEKNGESIGEIPLYQ